MQRVVKKANNLRDYTWKAAQRRRRHKRYATDEHRKAKWLSQQREEEAKDDARTRSSDRMDGRTRHTERGRRGSSMGPQLLFSGWRAQWALHLLEVPPSLVGLCAQTNHSFWVWLSSLGVVCGRRNTSQSDQTGNYCLLPLRQLHAATLLGCRTTHGSRFWACLVPQRRL